MRDSWRRRSKDGLERLLLHCRAVWKAGAREVSVDDAKLRELPVGGTSRADPQVAEAFLTMLLDGFGLNIRHEDGAHTSEATAYQIDQPPSTA
jgi:hypothetical protein